MAQLAQTFPVSHVSVEMPIAATKRAKADGDIQTQSPVSAPCPEPDGGMLLTPIRRGKEIGIEVAEVIPGSAAAKAGVAPGWLVLEYANKPAPSGRRIMATLLRLTPDQIGKWEGSGRDGFRNLAVPDGSQSKVASTSIVDGFGRPSKSGPLPAAYATSGSTSSRWNPFKRSRKRCGRPDRQVW
jgi:hypothetical protein